MPTWLPSIPYGPSRRGFWEPVTSTLNWCEEDYYATIYSAEIVNTLTNLLFITLACRGIANCLRNGHDSIFIVAFVGYLIVGSGSFLFHATLKYPMQLVDELSMIYTTSLMVYATFTYGRSKRFAVSLGIFLVFLCLAITLYYHFLQDPTFHQIAYAALTVLVFFRSVWVMEFNLRPSLKNQSSEQLNEQQNGETSPDDIHDLTRRRDGKQNGVPLSPSTQDENTRQDNRDAQILKTMYVMIAYGLSVFVGGFGIWNLDNIFCSSLRSGRRQVGLPWGIVLEGHGWWHIMTGVGAYFYIVWGIWLRHCLNGKQDEYELVWPRLVTSLPSIVRKKGSQQSGNGSAQNGAPKKVL